MNKTKKLLTIIIATFICSTVFAQNYHKIYDGLPFKMEKVTQPIFKKNVVLITDFGAKADGATSNTRAFKEAIEALTAKGGGKLIVPRGVWISGPIHLKSNINIHLNDGALILFSDNYDEYPFIEANYEGRNAIKATSPISGYNLENIAITGDGGGIIDGNGDNWRPVKRMKMTASQWNGLLKKGGVVNSNEDMWFPSKGAFDGYNNTLNYSELPPEKQQEHKAFYRPVMVSLVKCKNVLLKGVTFQNSPAWNIHPLMCENLTIDNIIVRNPWYSQNGDGLDIESCNNVIVLNSNFDVGDDAICIKSGKDKEGRERAMPTKNLIVDNCTVYHGHGGFVIGSEMSSGVNNVWVKNCTFIGTDVGLRFKSTRGRGGVVENIWIEGINMVNIPNEALLFDLFYGKREANKPVFEVTEQTPCFRNLFIKNIICRDAGVAMQFNGLPEMNVKNVTLENVFMQTTKGVFINDSENISFKNVVVKPKTGEIVTINNSKNIDTSGLK